MLDAKFLLNYELLQHTEILIVENEIYSLNTYY